MPGGIFWFRDLGREEHDIHCGAAVNLEGSREHSAKFMLQGASFEKQDRSHCPSSWPPGPQLFVVRPDDDLEALKAEVMEDMQDIFASVDKTGARPHDS